MEIKKSKPSLDLKLESLKDQFIKNLKETKLVVDPEINDLTLTYEQRRGLKTQEDCKIIQLGLKVMLKRQYNEGIDLYFETLDKQARKYQITLEILAETKEQEQQLAYDALTKISEFIESYKQIKKR